MICRENSVVRLLALKKISLPCIKRLECVLLSSNEKWNTFQRHYRMLVHFIFFIHMLFQTKMMKNKQNKPWDILLWNWKYSRITNKTRLGFSFMNSESFAVKKYFAHRQLWFSIQLPSYNNTSSQPTIWPQIHAQPNWESNWVENIFHFIFLGKMLYFSLWTTLLLVYYSWSLMVWWSWPLS